MTIVKMALAIIVILALFASGCTFFNSVIPTLAEGSDDSKISALLNLQVEAKLRAVEAGGVKAALVDSLEAGCVDILRTPGIRLDDLNKQRIFIHFAQEPTHSQIEELEAMGITPYSDSWIPPVGAHPTGFIIADMPADKLEELASKSYVVRLDTAEQVLEPQNDLATQKINADDVWSLGYDGTGVTIAVLDSGLDVTHNDIPTPTASKDYSEWPELHDTIANIVTGHGTHVTGSALGRGTQSSGVYKGSAPGANLIFLKIGKNATAGASAEAMAYAIRDAVDVYNADIITMSYGGWDAFHDGTSQQAQAVDYATGQGAVVFISAGNEADDDEHYSGTVAAFSSTGFIQIDVDGAGSGDWRTALAYNLVWYDGTGVSNDLELEYYDSSYTQRPSTNQAQGESSRGTESEHSYDNYYVVSDDTYYLKVKNNSSTSQFFHIYYYGLYNYPKAGTVKFASPDPDYTLHTPADADSAIAVGAYTTRKYWWDYNNSQHGTGETVDQICTFSSRGPRVDTGAPPKPNIVAPGSVIISCRDDDVYTWPGGANTYYIDNDGPNGNDPVKNDGSGPADYYVMHGTSMATPHAAGIAALILERNPGWTPARVKHALESTAIDKGAAGWDKIYGWGLIDALEASEPLDHFKHYRVAVAPYIGEEVQLEDQFGAFTATVGKAISFCNPVEKEHGLVTTPISDPDHHLTIYQLELEEAPQEWQVTVNNQFGNNQDLTVSGPVGLAVPTQKEGHDPPVGLDHYLIYDAYGPLVEGTIVDLTDQFFIDESFMPSEPLRFATPVQKTHGGNVTDIMNPYDHLVFYTLGNEYVYRMVQIDNQFGPQALNITMTYSSLLAVPSEKMIPVPVGDKAVSPEGYVQAGQTLDYTVRYDNVGEVTASGVYVTDVLHAGLDDSTLVIGAGGTYNMSTRTITWLIGTVGPGVGGNLTFSANVRSDATPCTAVTNYATVYFPSVHEEITTNIVVNIVLSNLTISSTAGGTVTTPGEGTFPYDCGTVVNLVATPDAGYRFVNWTGDVGTIADDEDDTTTITMNDDYSITANFEKGGCFIATAAYGTPMAEEIQILREFRDEYLLANPLGQALVDLYYRVSPPIAEFITEHPSLKPIVRAGLVPAVAMSTVAVNTTPAEKAVIIGLLVLVSVAVAVWATRRRGRGPQYT